MPVETFVARKVRRRVLGLALGAGALATLTASLATAAAISPEPVELARLAAPPSVQIGVAAAAGWTAWSDLVDGRYSLELRSPDGVVSSPAAVKPAVVPFRVALGRRSSGQIEAAYDVCPTASKPAARSAATIGPACRIMLLDVARGTVRKLALAAHTSSNALPALSGDTLAFAGVPTGRTAHSSVRVMTVRLGHRTATTRWSAKAGHGNGPVQLAVSGRSVAAIWSQGDGAEQRVDGQSAAGGKLRRLGLAGSDISCCEADQFASLAFMNSSTVSVLDVSHDEDGNADWRVDRLALGTGSKPAAGPSDSASGGSADSLAAVSLAEDAGRDVLLAADATHPFGVYSFAR